jgi:(5-formylfuran-3-yl)methyl phosphate synthase
MRLLVSVCDGGEAAVALDGGADIIDAKDPAAGPLGAVAIDMLREIGAAAGADRLVTAAIGDAAGEGAVAGAAFASATAGARLVKVGFAGIGDMPRAAALLRAAVRGASAGCDRCGVVAVAYADADQVASLHPDLLIDAAVAAGASGVLLDTADKSGPGLRGLMTQHALSAWVKRARQRGLMVALAGRLQLDDLDFVREAGADIAGVRGAACDGGRAGRISVEKVRALRRVCYQP